MKPDVDAGAGGTKRDEPAESKSARDEVSRSSWPERLGRGRFGKGLSAMNAVALALLAFALLAGLFKHH